MPKHRLPHNKPLPERGQFTHGAYYYRVPPGHEAQWDGKKRFRLGKTLFEAHQAFAQRVKPEKISTIGQQLDRYAIEVVPTNEPVSRSHKLRGIGLLRTTFGNLALVQPNWPQLFYQYVERRQKTVKLSDGTEQREKALTSAHRELEVMSHAFTKAVQWGLLARHPTYEQVRLDGDLALRPRTRDIEDWEVIEALSIASRRKKGSVLAIQAYIRLKLLTGLARSDLLRLRLDEHLKEDGIHVTRHKTRKTTGKRTIYEYSQVPERLDAVEQAKRVRPALSPFLFCNRKGEGYIDEETGECHGFDSMWSRYMDRVLAETKVTTRFTEHDLRAKVGSDAESLERARALLQHADAKTTLRIFTDVSPRGCDVQGWRARRDSNPLPLGS